MKWNSSWFMALCIVGMGAFFLLPTLGVSLGGLLSVGLILLCPLSHLLMMRGMHTGRESRHHGSGRVAGGVVGGEGATPGGAVPRFLSAGQPVAAIAAGSGEPARVERSEG
jgi:hypothetical protein